MSMHRNFKSYGLFLPSDNVDEVRSTFEYKAFEKMFVAKHGIYLKYMNSPMEKLRKKRAEHLSTIEGQAEQREWRVNLYAQREYLKRLNEKSPQDFNMEFAALDNLDTFFAGAVPPNCIT